MHEMGIAHEILRIVDDEAASRPGAEVKVVGLRIGECSGVDTESLTFCFDCLKTHQAELRIERTPADELDVAFIEMEVP